MIALENPVGLLSTVVRRPDQIIQPWMFGHSQDKRTCLWLKNLPLLRSTKVVPRGRRIYYESGKSLPEWYANISPSNRGKLRSVTYAGIAEAMAEQWGE